MSERSPKKPPAHHKNKRASSWGLPLMLCALVVAVGCAYGAKVAPAFSYRAAATPTGTLAALLSRPDAAPAPPSHATLFYTVAPTHDAAARIGASRITNEGVTPLWQRTLEVMSQPVGAGPVVVTAIATRGGNAVAVLDADDGRTRFTRPSRLPLVGAAAHGDTLYLVLSEGISGTVPRSSEVWALDLNSGTPRFSHRFAASAGAPFVARGLLWVPWDRQHLSALDLNDGRELGRLHLRDHALAFLVREEGELYYGYRNFHRLDASASRGVGDQSMAEPLGLPILPGEPLPASDSYLLGPAQRSAHGRVRLLARPGTAWAYYVYHRHIFSLTRDGDEMRVRWAARLQDEVAEVRWLASGLLVATEAGEVFTLAASDGSKRTLGNLGAVAAGTLVGEIDVTRTAEDNLRGERAENSEARLIVQLRDVASDRDNRLMASRKLAISALARHQDPQVTRDLLTLLADRSVRGPLHDTLTEALRGRTVSWDFLEAALRRGYDFVDGTDDAPLDVFVAWLDRDQSPESTAALVGLLNNPRVPVRDLGLVVDALARRTDATASAALAAFLRLYRADSVFALRKEALSRAAEGAFLHGGDSTRASLEAVAAAPGSHAYLRQHIQDLFAHAPRVSDAHASVESGQGADLARPEPAAATATRSRLGPEDVTLALESGMSQLRACAEQIHGTTTHLRRMRIDLTIMGTGQVKDVRVTPAPPGARRCLEDALAPVRFAAFEQTVQRVTLSLQLARDTPPTEVVTEVGPWWERLRARVADEPEPTRGLPFWQPRPPLRFDDFDLPASRSASQDEGDAGPDEARPWWFPTHSDE